jgi:hypothetical protein
MAIFAVGAAVVLAGCNRTPPPRRPGLWYQSFAQDGAVKGLGPMRASRVCIGAQTDANNAIFNFDLAVKLAKDRHCETPTAAHSLNGLYKFMSNCPLPNGNGRSLLEGTASGDFTSAYHLRMQTDTTYSPPFTPLNSRHVIDVDGKWLGPCPLGMAPGDMVLADGEKAPGGVLPDPHRQLSRPPS